MPTKWYQRRQGVEPPREWPRLPVFLILTLVVIALAISAPLWLSALARLLIIDEPPTRSGAILVLGGGNGSRQDRAIGLYQEGLASLIISSGEDPFLPGVGRSFAELGAEYMAARGIPREAILLLENTTSTYDEAVESLRLAKARGLTSLLVVTDHYHTRRARLTFRHVFRGSDIRVSVVAAQPGWFNLERWWTEERSFLAVVGEYGKLLYYLFKGYLF